VKFLIQTVNRRLAKEKKRLYIPVMFALLRAFRPVIYRGNTNNSLEKNNVELILFIVLFFKNLYFGSKVYTCLANVVYDLVRKQYLMDVLSNLLIPKKLEDTFTKVLPTLDLLTVHSIRSWWIYRAIFMDYGKKFQLRVEAFQSIFLVVYLALLITLIIQYFELANIWNDPMVSWIFLTEIAIFCFLFSLTMYKAAVVNDNFRVHKSLLHENKSRLNDVYSNLEIYVNSTDYQSESIMHVVISKRIKWENVQLNGQIDKLIIEIIKMINTAIKKLDFESEHSPQTILGIPASYALLGKVAASLGSVGAAAIQKYMASQR